MAGGAFTFMLCWSEILVAEALNTKPGAMTLLPVIAAVNAQIKIDYSVIAASGFLGALPAVILVQVFQWYLVQGPDGGVGQELVARVTADVRAAPRLPAIVGALPGRGRLP